MKKIWIFISLLIMVNLTATDVDFSWSIESPMPTVRSSGMSAVVGDTIYTINGHEGHPGTGRIVEAYHVSTDSWSTKATYPRSEGRYNQGVAVVNDEIYVFGGTNIWGNYYTNTVDKYVPSTDSWILDVGVYPLPEISGLMCATVNNQIYCFGGISSYSSSTYTDSVFMFNPADSSFIAKANMPTVRSSGMAFPIGDKIYVIAGSTSGTYNDDVEIYDTVSDSWSVGTDIPLAVSKFAGGVINEKIYVASGSIESTRSDITDRTFEYDPVLESWEEKEPIQYARNDAFGGVVNNKLYVIGGNDQSGVMPGSGVNYTEEGFLYSEVLNLPLNGDANDISGYENDGIPHNGVDFTATDRFGNANSSISCDGADDYISIPHDASFSPTDEISISLFFKTSNFEQEGKALLSKKQDEGYNFQLNRPNDNFFGQLALSDGDKELGFPMNEVLYNRWNHVILTYDGSFVRLFHNTVCKDSVSASGAIPHHSDCLMIGAELDTGCNAHYFCESLIDDVVIYDHSLTQNEIDCVFYEGGFSFIIADFTSNITEGDAPLEVSFTDSSIAMGTTITSWEWDFGDGNTSTEQNPVYTYPTAGTYDVSLIVSDGIISDTLLIEDYITAFGLVADYPFTNGSVADSSGNGNDGTNNGATPTIDRFGNSDCAFDFDGSSHITVNDFNFGANNSITISAWAYCEGTNNDHPRVIDFLPSSYWVNYQTVSDIYMFGMASGYYGFSHNNNINRWKHIIAQYDHTNSKMKLYVDGIIVDSVNVSVSTPELTNIFIGDSGEIPNQRNFIGKIDDISIYNTILNQNEINSLYHSGGWPYINADFTSNVTEGDAPLEVSFTDSSIAMGTTITSWEWYFGDGNTSTEQNPVYIYETAGIYDVTLIVSDGVVSDTLTIEDYITVNFDVDFIAVPTSGFFPLVVDFTDLTIGNPTSWHWDYDDGNSSSEQNPSHTFWNSGVYDIELIVSNAAKTDTLVKSAYITVDDLLTPLNEPQIYRMEDMPNDQGHQLRIYWVRSQRDESEIHPYILFYSLWRRMDDLPRNANSIQIITENELPEYNEKDIVNNRIFISGRDEYWEGVGTVGAIHQSWYSYVAPTLIDSNSTDTNFSFFKIYAHTNINTFYESVPDSGYSVDNIPPNPADEVYIAVNGNNIELSWDEVSDGSYSGNSYPEQNGVWYKIYASDEPYFVCDETNLIDTVSDPEYIYTVGTEDKKFFKIVVSDQP